MANSKEKAVVEVRDVRGEEEKKWKCKEKEQLSMKDQGNKME